MRRLGEVTRKHRILLKPFFQDKDIAKIGRVSFTRMRSILDNNKIPLTDSQFTLLCNNFAYDRIEFNYLDFIESLKQYEGYEEWHSSNLHIFIIYLLAYDNKKGISWGSCPCWGRPACPRMTFEILLGILEAGWGAWLEVDRPSVLPGKFLPNWVKGYCKFFAIGLIATIML